MEWKADVHIKDSHGETPLHFAAATENKIIVKHLVLAGADALAADHDSDIPLLWTSDTDTRAALLDGCWHELSCLTLMLLNINLLAEFLDQDVLQPVCRSLRRHMPLCDAFGGSSSPSLHAPQEHTTDDDRNVRIAHNKNVARERKMRRLVTWADSGMQVPVRGDGVDALLPLNYQYFAPCQDILTLAWLHPHPRDPLVRFQAEGHLYFVKGEKTRGSVTGLVHAFAHPFDTDATITAMVTGSRWPRAGYLRASFDDTVLTRIRQIDVELLLAILEVPRNDPWICERLQSWRDEFPDLLEALALNREEIKRMWDMNRADAAACGTYMHYMFEAHLNGYRTPRTSQEFAMLLTFLQGMEGWRAFRTEWMIFGEEENIAGSIDLCAINAAGELALIDWKRSAGLENKYSSLCRMKPPLGHLADCAGYHYRLQLNAYRYIIEKYYGFKVVKMLVVCTHPDRQLRPFVDDVPRLEGEIESIMKLWCGDSLGGAAAAMSLSQGSFADAIGAELEAMDAEERERDRHVGVEAGVGPPSHMEELDAAPNPQDDAKLRQCKKRRLLPGAADSSQRFDSQFATLRETAAEPLRTAPLQEPSKMHSLLFQSTRIIEKVREMQPSWPEQLIRLVAAASVLPHMRLSDAYLREHIHILWLMEGGRFLRVHNGQCFLYHDSGAFQVFRGSPPEQTVARVKEFILQLEGMFRLLPSGVNRSMESIVQCVAKMEEDTEGGIGPMLNTWIAAAIYKQEPERPRRRHGEGLAGSDGEHEGGGRGEPPQRWPQVVANAISKLSVTLQREVMDEKIYGLMIEWCETPRVKRPGCAYYDACVVFDEEGQPVKFVPPSHTNNIYTLIPHHLKPAIPDPVLAAAPCLDCSMLLFPLAFWYSSFKF